jgi:uncharacterized protein YdcH (DUF465 family)
MEKRDLERIHRLLPRDPELARLWEEHGRFEAELERLDLQRLLTPEEATRRTELKKRKLAGKDRIQEIIDREA